METFDAGHVETEKNLPGPLRPGWYPGTWALPATTISGASLFVLVAIFGCLQIGSVSRALFQLPVPSWWVALAAAALACLLAWACRNRPGGMFARLWTLALASVSSGVALATLLSPDLSRHPQIHGLALACCVASLTLLPRLLRLHPAHWLVQHIAPLTLLLALLLALPAALLFARQAVKDREQRLADTIAELNREADEVRAVSSTAWADLPGQRQEALKQMQRLQALSLDGWVPDRHLWQGAALLGKDDELAGAYRKLLESVVSGIDPARTPKLWQAQFAWNRVARRWERDPLFPEQSAAVAGYHWRLGRMLRLLAPPVGEGAALHDLAVFYDGKKQEMDERLTVLSETWTEDWVPPLYSADEPAGDPPVSPLAELLQRPLERERGLTAASFERLLDLDLRQAKRLLEPTPGCGGRDYMEDGWDYYRVDCFAYAARLDPEPGADLRVEMRLVYKAEMETGFSLYDVPVELYFLFPVPASLSADAYREDVMTAVETAVRSQHPAVSIDRSDRSGSSAKGFSFETQAGRRLRVEPSTLDDLSGGVPGIQVRGYYQGAGL